MNHKRTSDTQACERAEQTQPTFNVAIVYDDRIAAARAMNVFSGLVCQFDGEFEFHCDLWRFDVLELPEAREAAVVTGTAADLIIVSARGDNDLPAAVKDWLDRCVAEKNPGSAALVGLLESRRRPGDVQCRTSQFLQSAADRSLMDFFLHDVDLPNTSPGRTPEKMRARANSASSVLEGILHRAEPPQRPRAWEEAKM